MTGRWEMMDEREAIYGIVRWCPIGEMWEPAHEDGRQMCSGCDTIHYLRKRRMYVCSLCEMAFFTKPGFAAHECYSAY